MRTRPGGSRSRLCCDYRGGGGLLPSRWKENCDYPAAAIRGAALSERLSEARRLSRAEWSATIVRLSCDYSATIQRLFSDYRRANPAPKFFQTFQKLFKNPIRIFSKPFEKSSGFCAAGEGLSRRRGLGSGRLGRLGDGRQPPGRARSAAGGDPRAAQGLNGAAQVIRVRRSGVRRAAAVLLLPSIAVMPLWGAYAPAMAFLRSGIGIYALSYRKRSEDILEALRAIGIYARISGGRRGRARTRAAGAGRAKAPPGIRPDGAKKAAHSGRQMGYESRAIQIRINTGSSRAYNRIMLSPPAHTRR